MAMVVGQGGAAKSPKWNDLIGTWLFSVAAVIVMPLLPLLVEAAKNHYEIKSENLLLTTAVLAVGFGFSSEGNLYRACYLLLFFFSIGLDFGITEPTGVAHPSGQGADASAAATTIPPEPLLQSWLFSHPGYFVAVVCLLHAIERLQWHVGEKKKFPDWLK